MPSSRKINVNLIFEPHVISIDCNQYHKFFFLCLAVEGLSKKTTCIRGRVAEWPCGFYKNIYKILISQNVGNQWDRVRLLYQLIFDYPTIMLNFPQQYTLGSEIQTILDFGWTKKGWVANGPDSKWDLNSGSRTI